MSATVGAQIGLAVGRVVGELRHHARRVEALAVQRARQLAPRRSGALERSIGSRVRDIPGGVAVGLLHRPGFGVPGRTAPDVYGEFVERGTRRMKAHPHLGPGLLMAMRAMPFR